MINWWPLARGSRQRKTKNSFVPWQTLIGVLLDLFDYMVLGFLPIVGDLVDGVAALYWLKVLGPLGLIAAVELIPLADVLPTNIVLGLYADYERYQK